MRHWASKIHEPRRVSMRAILDKLNECKAAGVDIDRIPLSLTVKDLLRMPVLEIAMRAGGSKGAAG